MPCNPALIACQLDRLVESSGDWDWNGFFSTLIATLVGAGIGIVAVWLSFHWQSKHRYVEVLDESVIRVLEQIAAFAKELQAYQEQRDLVDEYKASGSNFFARTGDKPLSNPPHFSLSIALDTAQIRARGIDQEIVSAAIRAHEYGIGATAKQKLAIIGLVGGALSRWRAGIWSTEDVSRSLERIGSVVGVSSAPNP
ncbi:hypothetical protein MN032_05775 [Agromyces atrinae]|uniref:hypothetical protein n=1 Tax=Agromyces atrinae TaxID=592376 RepID=UPI001F5815CB|nr:hypothetical protein [Agromyces atrinae]MCI2957194.1 hypothetical protein [Agromyces atrinae]